MVEGRICGLAYNSNHVRSHILWNNDPAADFERGEFVAMHQLIGTGTGDPKHCGNFCHGEHQRKLIITFRVCLRYKNTKEVSENGNHQKFVRSDPHRPA